MLVLGLETSCDETAAGIVQDAVQPQERLLANVVATQFEEHKPYGGVVPEIAARAHLDHMDDLVRRALHDAKVSLMDIDAVAATCGPGLIGGVMVGAMTAKALAVAAGKPFIAVNHLEAHALTVRLTHDVAFPYLLLLVSGGHTQLLLVEGVGQFRCFGTTRDDAVGECFDKSAKLLGLGYPGGAMIELAAAQGNRHAIALPKPMVGRSGCDFSFSGLKTAVRLAVSDAPQPLSKSFVADMAASLQCTIATILADRTAQAFAMARVAGVSPTALVVGGGVAANTAIREAMGALASQQGVPFMAPPPALCTDNGVMIAWTGLERFKLGFVNDFDFRARPRWPLEDLMSEKIRKEHV